MAYDKAVNTGMAGRPPGATNASKYLQLPYDSTNDTFPSGQTKAPQVHWGAGTPEGARTGNVGDFYIRGDGGVSGAGTVVYQKVVGNGTNTGWEPIHPKTSYDGWYVTNVVANQAETIMLRGQGFLGHVLIARPAICTALWVVVSATPTAGSIFLQVTRNATTAAGDLQVEVNSTSTTVFFGMLAPGTPIRVEARVDRKSTGTGLGALLFAAGDALTIRYRTTAALLPTGTLDLVAGVELVPAE